LMFSDSVISLMSADFKFISSRLLNLNTRRVADGQIDLSSPKYENHLLNAVLCVPSISSPLIYTMHVDN
jgi:hypothetical protein